MSNYLPCCIPHQLKQQQANRATGGKRGESETELGSAKKKRASYTAETGWPK